MTLDQFFEQIKQTLAFYEIELSDEEVEKLFAYTSFYIGKIVGERDFENIESQAATIAHHVKSWIEQ